MATIPNRRPTAATGAIWPVMLPVGVGAGSSREQLARTLMVSKSAGRLAHRRNVEVIEKGVFC